MGNTKNIGIFAHVDAGKTTTTEQMLFLSGKIKNLGSVDKGETVTDYNEIEKRRGITVFSEEVSLRWKDTTINIIDTPGHLDFSSETQRSILPIDGAILIISALEGVQGYTEKLWTSLRNYNIPTLIFINKIDRVGVDLNKTFNNIESSLTSDFVILENLNSNNKERNDLIEKLSDKNDKILEMYLDNEYTENDVLKNAITELSHEGKLFPLIIGSAIEGKGIKNILDAILEYIPFYESKSEEKPTMLVYKVKHDPSIGKLTYVKVLSGQVKIRDGFFINGEEEKISSIRKYIGEKCYTTDKLECGDIGAICGLKTSMVGDIIGKTTEKNYFSNIESCLRTKVFLQDNEKYMDLLKALKILNEEDPSLNLQINNEIKEATINIMGIVHMEIIKEVFLNRFGLNIKLETPRVNFLETITESSKGFCHYEPKKHYAEVELKISPKKLGEGFTYVSNVSLDILPLQFQNLIEKTMNEALKHGIVLGERVTDIEVKLIGGKYDLEHTHGGDFRIATIRAMQKALEENNCKLLEPLYKFDIVAPLEYMGKIMSDILKMKGEFKEPKITEDKVKIYGEVPIQNAMNYPIELASMTSGKASISLSFSRYIDCHNSEEILKDENNKVYKDTSIYNSISLFRENRKMKKVY
ncbi:translation elongation factor G [Clostridiaceae bacterium 14S0207]|nr:translation elongation factor G [Clostridiaceae bacterium 14S0207]